MNTPSTFTVDFVARGERPDEWNIVLVEEGPWQKNQIEIHLRKLQGRLFECIDAVLDGQLADKFPDSMGAKIIIQVDGYNLPQKETKEFFDRFSQGVFEIDDYRRALQTSPYTREISLEIRFDSIRL